MTNTKFKAGDKVRILDDNNSSLAVGKVYTIEGIGYGGSYVIGKSKFLFDDEHLEMHAELQDLCEPEKIDDFKDNRLDVEHLKKVGKQIAAAGITIEQANATADSYAIAEVAAILIRAESSLGSYVKEDFASKIARKAYPALSEYFAVNNGDYLVERNEALELKVEGLEEKLKNYRANDEELAKKDAEKIKGLQENCIKLENLCSIKDKDVEKTYEKFNTNEASLAQALEANAKMYRDCLTFQGSNIKLIKIIAKLLKV